MSDITIVFGFLESLLMLVSGLTFLWGIKRGWEMEMFLPVAMAAIGTVVLVVSWMVVVIVHDHLHIAFT
jgi:hypothetical protein